MVSAGCAVAIVAALTLVGGAASASPRPLDRGGRISSVALPSAVAAHRGASQPAATCMKPGGTNYQTDCNNTGHPVNETTIANNGSLIVAGANDYNSYNGNSDLGYYTSTDGKTWTDNGPLDLFAQGTFHAAGDPGLAIDAAGVVYYSSIYFDYNDCTIGGVELARKDPSNGTWSTYQIQANSNAMFEDKPAIMQDGRHVFVSWTHYGSCDGIGVTSPIKVAVFNPGATSGPPVKSLAVPGSTYSQGSAMATDGHGGFWITWEEFPSASSTIGSIMLAHWSNGTWSAPTTISPVGFTDLPSPLPGFLFRDNSFPMIATAAGRPAVVWTSYDSGAGRCYVYRNGQVRLVSDTGGDQFFPSVAADANGKLAISYSQTSSANSSFDQYLSYNGSVTKVSTASSFPNSDPSFGGTFIGDYNEITVLGTAVHPIWTDLRSPTFLQHAMEYAA
jgi:hypothetical protein